MKKLWLKMQWASDLMQCSAIFMDVLSHQCCAAQSKRRDDVPQCRSSTGLQDYYSILYQSAGD